MKCFNLEGEWGEAFFVRMEMNTADAQPIKQTPRRMVFVVCQEMGKQLKEMQQTGTIQLSSSPWSSSVGMVKKKDGSHRLPNT